MIAVTGASGLLGRQLVDQFLLEGFPVVAVVRDKTARFPAGVVVRHANVLDPFELEESFEDCHTVVHAAALVSFNPRRRDEILSVNVGGTRNTVDVCLKMGIVNFIQISSVAALGRRPGVSIHEEDPWTGQYANIYGESKYLAELEVFRGAEEGLTIGLVNPAVVLSGTPLHRSSGSLFDYVWQERKFYTRGMLNYVDGRDVADAVVKLIRQPRPGERFTLCAGSIPFIDFFQSVALQWNKRPPSVSVPDSLVKLLGFIEEARCLFSSREPLVTRQTATMATHHFRYDSTKAREQLGISFRTIDDTLSWCCTTYARHVNRNK